MQASGWTALTTATLSAQRCGSFSSSPVAELQRLSLKTRSSFFAPSYIYCESGIQYFLFLSFLFCFFGFVLVFQNCKQTKKEEREKKEKQTFPFKGLDLAAHHIDEREGIPLSVLRYGTCQSCNLYHRICLLLSCCPLSHCIIFS